MSRPEHLRCVNTPEGIRRINEEQREYDKDPEAYERRERERREEYERENIEIIWNIFLILICSTFGFICQYFLVKWIMNN